ncbi:MAG: leucine-rich repeat domain-containing protein [Treponema sp.]|jgi:hypothetical protein|nr:leucine-rich repeat domain-containing protein [Treponema sp.]
MKRLTTYFIIFLTAQIILSEGLNTHRVSSWTKGGLSATLKSDGTLIISGSDWGRGMYRERGREVGSYTGPTPCKYGRRDYRGISITNVIIEKNVEAFHPFIFNECTNLMSINVDKDNIRYTSIDGVLFGYNPYYFTGSSADLRDVTLIRYPQGRQGAYTLPSDSNLVVSSIGEFAFSNCTGLTSVILPDGLVTIKKGAFYGCTNLTSITIPSDMEGIGKHVFAACKNLTSINVNKGNSHFTSFDGSHFTSIDGILFYNYEDNGRLENLIRYPPSKQGVSYKIPNGVWSIETNAFEDCNNLTSVTIPRSVKSIEKYAFYNLAIRSITVWSWTPPRSHNFAFSVSDSACLYVPRGRVRAYRRAKGWEEIECIKPTTRNRKGTKNE